MKETPLTHDIASNVGSAAQAELEGDSKSELRHLLFASQDIIEMLKVYRADRMSRPPTEWMDLNIAKRHANLLSRVSKRIAELIEQGT
jgi:hypothetical protein